MPEKYETPENLMRMEISPDNAESSMTNSTSISPVLVKGDKESSAMTEKPKVLEGSVTVMRKPRMRNITSVLIGDIIGDGTFGVVFKGMDPESREVLALKKIKLDNILDQNGRSQETDGSTKRVMPLTAMREIKNLMKLNHENIVTLKELFTASSNDSQCRYCRGDVFMSFDYIDGDLAGLMDTPEVAFTPGHIYSYMRQLLEGLNYAHSLGIIHRDIKPANILITKDNRVKIADWGLSKMIGSFSRYSQRLMTNPVVTLWYRPPELILEAPTYSFEVDMWSVGCVFAEMHSRVPILSGPTEIILLEEIYKLLGSPASGTLIESKFKRLPYWSSMRICRQYSPSLREKLSHLTEPSALELIEQLVCLDYEKRLSATEALNHHYFEEMSTQWPDGDIERISEFEMINAHYFESRRERKKQEKKRYLNLIITP